MEKNNFSNVRINRIKSTNKWTEIEEQILRLCILKYGSGCYSKIINNKHLSRNKQQIYNKVQRWLNTQALSQYRGIHLELNEVREYNLKHFGEKYRINNNKLTDDELIKLRDANYNLFNKPMDYDQIGIPELMVENQNDIEKERLVLEGKFKHFNMELIELFLDFYKNNWENIQRMFYEHYLSCDGSINENVYKSVNKIDQIFVFFGMNLNRYTEISEEELINRSINTEKEFDKSSYNCKCKIQFQIIKNDQEMWVKQTSLNNIWEFIGYRKKVEFFINPPACWGIKMDLIKFDQLNRLYHNLENKRLQQYVSNDLIIMDPPWKSCGINNPVRGVNLQYPLLGNKQIEIVDLTQVQSGNNGFIGIWVTNSSYQWTLEYLNRYGYVIIDEIIWVKTTNKSNILKTPGYYFQHCVESMLIATRNKLILERNKLAYAEMRVRRRLNNNLVFSGITIQSSKPSIIYDKLDRAFWCHKKCELFGRWNNLRSQWLTIGLEIDCPKNNSELEHDDKNNNMDNYFEDTQDIPFQEEGECQDCVLYPGYEFTIKDIFEIDRK
jgi:N6-adenosine-specific RNA methylase IME4